MQYSKLKASLFPYLVVLCVVLAHVLIDGRDIWSLLQQHVDPGFEDAHERSLYMSMGADIGSLVIYAALSLALTQWWFERRHIASLPAYAAMCIGALILILVEAWLFATAIPMLDLMDSLVGMGYLSLAIKVSMLANNGAAFLLTIFSIWFVFRLLRRYERTSVGPVELRGRALSIFTLSVLSWVMLLLVLSMPTMSNYFFPDEVTPTLLHLGPYAGSFGLVLPAFFGALLGLPCSMQAIRPVRMCLAATLAVLACAATMVVATFISVQVVKLFGVDVGPTIGLAAWLAVIWLAVSTPLCWWLIRLMFPSIERQGV